MAVQSKLTSVKVTIKTNNGMVDGKQKYNTVSLGNLSTANYNDQKAMNVVTLIEPCLAQEVLGVQKAELSDLVEGE